MLSISIILDMNIGFGMVQPSIEFAMVETVPNKQTNKHSFCSVALTQPDCVMSIVLA